MKIEHNQGIDILGSSDKIVLEPNYDLPVFIGDDFNDNPCLCFYDAVKGNVVELVSHEDLSRAEFTIINNIINIIVNKVCLFSGKIYIKPRSIDEIIDSSVNR